MRDRCVATRGVGGGGRVLNMPTIMDLLKDIDRLDPEDIIFAKPEWREDSEARIFPLMENNRLPPEAETLGYKYFLEVDVIRQVLNEFRNQPDVPLVVKCRRVIHYATFDA